ncbi:diacylglycerol kinase family protein [Nocardia sp. NPDC059228]|uniref:diacylglycerol kinase family protein n=1 Tax=Nocardia sp. NPDC059228 TaxID=3346777 RepID=UPI0036C01E88
MKRWVIRDGTGIGGQAHTRDRVRRRFHRVGRTDRAVTAAIARLPVSSLDPALLCLTRSADFGALWLLIAGVLSTRKGEQRRAAVRGVASLGCAALLVDAILEPAAATVALRHGLPLAVFPTGTLNHFARDPGVRDPRETAAAVATGKVVGVDIARIEFDDETGPKTRLLLNTAGPGTYPDPVRTRRRWRSRWGRWPRLPRRTPARAAPGTPRRDSHQRWQATGMDPVHRQRALSAAACRPRLS